MPWAAGARFGLVFEQFLPPPHEIAVLLLLLLYSVQGDSGLIAVNNMLLERR